DRADKLILFSAAEPNQPGIDHINCKLISYWIEKWDELGWEPMLFDTLAFRVLSTFSWMKRNTLILKKRDSRGKFSVGRLKLIGAKEFKWWKQTGRIVKTPFMEYGDEAIEENDKSRPYGARTPLHSAERNKLKSDQERSAVLNEQMDLPKALERIKKIERKFNARDQELNSIKKSRTWKFARLLWKITRFFRIV
ncbi:hypothetical protein ACFL2O_11095, partial [Thermodesulfobacteriota bacterium]